MNGMRRSGRWLQNSPVPRLPVHSPQLFNKKDATATSKLFSTHERLDRDRSIIYNTHLKPIARLVEGESKETRKRSLETISPPPLFTESLRKALSTVYSEESARFSEYFPAGLKFDRYIKSRTLPLEGVLLRRKEKQIKEQLASEFNLETQPLDTKQTELSLDSRTREYNNRKSQLEKKHLNRWVPVLYDKTCSLAYLLVRTPAEYAVMETIFKEIKRQEPEFRPMTMFDYGSGLCSAYWAATTLWGKLSEVFCVDSSVDMNDLAKNIILQGNEQERLPTGMNFRLKAPSSTSLKYDLVVSAFSLMESESANHRLQIIHSLWERVEEGGSLVLAELGTNAGFQIISEARDYIFQTSRESSSECDAIAPCPHSLSCPRYHNDNIPCNFKVKYRNFDIEFFKKQRVHEDRFSYVVMKKGGRSGVVYPRLVEEPLKAKNNFYCRLCTQQGTLQEVTCNKRHNNTLYHFAKFVHWGQEFPVKLSYPDRSKEVAEDPKEDEHELSFDEKSS